MPCGQISYHKCHIGNHFISLWMIPHNNFEHRGGLYIVFLIFGNSINQLKDETMLKHANTRKKKTKE
jgi:hypothetical protein